jgi:hypothetical protein
MASLNFTLKFQPCVNVFKHIDYEAKRLPYQTNKTFVCIRSEDRITQV